MRLSYSRWSCYHECPFKYKCKYILKLREPKGEAMGRGTLIHDMLEQYILGKTDLLPWNENNSLGVPAMGAAHPMQSTMEFFKGGQTERVIELDIDLAPNPKDGEPAFIAILDADKFDKDTNTLHIGEWKSGKPYASHAEQRHMYATVGLGYLMPDHVIVTTHYVDISSNPVELRADYKDFKEMSSVWKNRRESMMNDTILAPRPNPKCKWCHFRKSNGGICPIDM